MITPALHLQKPPVRGAGSTRSPGGTIGSKGVGWGWELSQSTVKSAFPELAQNYYSERKKEIPAFEKVFSFSLYTRNAGAQMESMLCFFSLRL